MNARNLALMAAVGSMAMLLGAFAFQVFGEMAPCKLCIWQRWPHGLAFGVGLLALLLPHRALYALGGLVVLFGAGVALYHTGVEQHWWVGPTTCTSQGVAGLTAQQLMDQILNAPLVRCDEIPWSMFGMSMAAWNGVVSLGLAGLWAVAYRKA
ncbi:MAG: disulfide bond formation protein B [Rhodobacterales bacterium]|nr:disulfide bond formation protein B [Pseudomonadota bacterium]MDA1286944.1 disulfide bond formation protein B [Pseudomonadota bacterium]